MKMLRLHVLRLLRQRCCAHLHRVVPIQDATCQRKSLFLHLSLSLGVKILRLDRS